VPYDHTRTIISFYFEAVVACLQDLQVASPPHGKRFADLRGATADMFEAEASILPRTSLNTELAQAWQILGEVTARPVGQPAL